MTTTTTRTELQAALDAANGRRQVRTLELSEIVDVAEDLRPGQHKFLHGGHVANSYGYAALATAAVVWRDSRGATFAIFRVTNAAKGSTGFGREAAWSPQIELAPAVDRVRFADQLAAYEIDVDELPFRVRSKADLLQASDWFAERGDETNAKGCAGLAAAKRLIK